MKITGHGDSFSITLRSGRDIASLLKGISVGDSVKAHVISREGNIALLDISGNRIRAEFTSGIPPEKIITLILSEKTGTFAVFRLATESPGGVNLADFLKQNFIMQDKVPDRGLIAGLTQLLARKGADLFDINLFLSGQKKDRLKDDKITDVINRLFLSNVPKQALADLSLMAALRLPLPLFYTLLYIMERSGKKSRIIDGDGDETERLFNEISESLSDDELFADLVKVLSAQDKPGEMNGEFPFPEGDGFTKLEYIRTDDSYFISLSLSVLGRINARIRQEGNCVWISIGSADDETVKALEDGKEKLKSSLAANGIINPVILFFNYKKIVDKLELLCTDFHNKYGIDLKI